MYGNQTENRKHSQSLQIKTGNKCTLMHFNGDKSFVS